LLPVGYQFSKDQSLGEVMHTAIDFISGLSDSYAMNLFRKLNGISL